jgi:DNA-binding transcriptional LysR family regulator
VLDHETWRRLMAAEVKRILAANRGATDAELRRILRTKRRSLVGGAPSALADWALEIERQLRERRPRPGLRLVETDPEQTELDLEDEEGGP